MKLLLDTHCFLWCITDKKKLSPKVMEAISNPDNTVYVSAIVFWEISLKSGIGKLSLTGLPAEELPAYALQMGFELLPLLATEAAGYSRLTLNYHKDPFDRMLIWQAIEQKLTLVTKDDTIKLYKSDHLKILW
jgi:PIN domain nuclease of toxin-antitoxin system